MFRHGERAHAQWRRSRRSQEQGACVELAELPGVIAVRDSKNPEGPVLVFDADVWRVFHARMVAGGHDL
ncbi:DUF397 domain-containing protein [Actinomadura alba]|uniref:DUF397 domain-containing protein n=2 Tax=Actinomadura alba TaxID=406431 RepID=A0ABR7M1R8_9ACTN|nr:DUF397 domain-containing protein [Actinomadura alba]MBC6471062.1 DUF397 domain-containing protein [Actinomadura alba]